MHDLTDEDRRALRFAQKRFVHWGAREAAIHAEFGLSDVRFQQWLNGLLDNPQAYVEFPTLVKRLRRLRETRRARRAS